MRIEKRLYVRDPQNFDRARFEYREKSWTLPKKLTGSDCSEEERHEATEAQACLVGRHLPGDSHEWTLDHIFCEGDHSGIANSLPLTYTFVFKRPRRRS